MKKFLSVLTVLALVGTLAFAQVASENEKAAPSAQGGKAKFKNVVHTDTVSISADEAKFAGAYEDMQAWYNSDLLDIYARGRIVLNEEYANYIGYNHSKTRFGIKYKPGYGIELGIGQAYYIPGAYMAVEDDYVEIGNAGTAGFNFGYKPVSGLTLVASFDFVSGVYNNYIYDAAGNYIFNTGFGGWYEFTKDGEEDPLFTVGAAFEYNRNGDVTNPYHAGFYASVTPISDLSIYAGYTYNAPEGDLYITADHAVNLSVSYEINDFYCAADYNTDFDDNFYTGLLAGYVVDDFDISLCLTGVSSYSDFVAGEFCINPGCSWQINDNHSFAFGVDVNFAGGAWDSIDIPLEWVFKF
ncbi:MAG: hypothetical protein SPI86_10285 [Treponemataceae bacterium]|nr:hypothetical protein [Spirochaetales bacterium]MDY6032125.1 hypothetical protein [Treponemataceae bacterium]